MTTDTSPAYPGPASERGGSMPGAAGESGGGMPGAAAKSGGGTPGAGPSPSELQADASSASAEAQEQSLAEINRIFTERLQSGQFDDLTIREVKTKAAQEAEQLLVNDAQASIVSVIVFIVWT